MATVEYRRQVGVVGEYDVVVCGGGPAGIMAAIAAARNGARTAIVERYAFFGGTASGGLVNPISEFNKHGKRVIGGLPWEFVTRLYAKGGAIIDFPNGNVPFDPELYKLVAQEMLLEAGVKIYLHSMITDCIKDDDNRIMQIVMATKHGLIAIGSSYFIDCTGDADLAAYAGVTMLDSGVPGSLQPASLCFILSGVDIPSLGTILPRLENTRYFNQRVHTALEELKEQGYQVPNYGGPWFCSILDPDAISVNLTRCAVNPLDRESLVEAECTLRSDMFRFIQLCKEHVSGFEHCRLLASGIQAGIRESRRIAGVHVVTGEEFLKNEHFHDTIALGAHPLDIHRATDTQQEVHFLQDCVCIPYRSLITQTHPNLLVAGRCLSADRYASASIRVQAPVMATGEAAGTAAALCVAKAVDVQQADIAGLIACLEANGAVVRT